MTRANSEQLKHTPWFAKAGAASSIVPIARFVGPNVFALKGGGYGCLFALTGIDEEGLTDQELDARMRSIEGALRGLPEGSCLYQYTRIMSGFELPRQRKYTNPITQVFVDDRLAFLERTAGFRRIDLHWCLTLEPSQVKAFQPKPKENAVETSRMLADLQKAATILEGHLGSLLGLRLVDKNTAFQFFSYLFNLEEWAASDQLREDTGVDRQIVKTPVEWHSDHLRVGKRYVQMFSLKTTPEASRPCLFSGLLTLDCDSVLCSTWRVKSSAAARSEIDAQEKFISFFKVGILARVMNARDTASLETGAGARAANSSVDDLSEVIRSLDKKAQGEYSLRLLLAGNSAEQLRDVVPSVHRIFVDARVQVIEETLGNLSAYYAMFPGNRKFNVFPLWLSEDHHARLTDVHIISDHGNEYTLQLREVSGDADPHFDSKVFLVPGDKAAKDRLAELPVFVPASELDKVKQEAAAAQAAQTAMQKAEATKEEEYRSQYPGTLYFDYTWDKAKGKELGLEQIWRDDKFTYLRGQFQETPALYEVKDKKPSLINFDFNNGLYTVPKELDNGYLEIGKQKVEFHRTEEGR